jgi:hypothetical protein
MEVEGMKKLEKKLMERREQVGQSWNMEKMPLTSLGFSNLSICNLTMSFYQDVEFGLN